MTTTTFPQRKAFREPMVWLVTLLPALVVVAGIATVVIAVRAGGNDAVPDTVRRTAQIQVAELAPEARAQALGLAAVLRVQDGRIELLPVDGEFERGARLSLHLAHPSRAQDDRVVELMPDALGWHAEDVLADTHDWQLRLAPTDGSWRLHGRLPAGQSAAHLASTLH